MTIFACVFSTDSCGCSLDYWNRCLQGLWQHKSPARGEEVMKNDLDQTSNLRESSLSSSLSTAPGMGDCMLGDCLLPILPYLKDSKMKS